MDKFAVIFRFKCELIVSFCMKSSLMKVSNNLGEDLTILGTTKRNEHPYSSSL